MTEKEATQMMGNINKLIDKKIDERFNSVLQIKPATIMSVSSNNLKVSVKILGSELIINDIDNYDIRAVTVGMPCFIGYWGAGGKRLNSNVFLFLGGSTFR